MLRFLFKAGIFVLLAAYLVKILSAGRRRPASAPPANNEPQRRIPTDGLEVRDAEFTEVGDQDGGRV